MFGRCIQVANAQGQSINLSNDLCDRLVAANDALVHTTSDEYDGRHNRSKIFDANGHESRQVLPTLPQDSVEV